MDAAHREKLRMQLLSFGAEVVIGEARGSGDSADAMSMVAARYVMPGDNVEVEDHTTDRKSPGSNYVSQESRRKVWENGELVFDGNLYMRHHLTATDAEFIGILDEFDKAVCSLEVKIPAELQNQLDDLLGIMIDDAEWWDFNDDGSFGEFAWNLETNKARVEGGYWITETKDETENDPLDIEAEKEEDTNV